MNDLPVGRNPDEFLRLVKAFQFTDEHKQVCPANWQPGQKTMIPDPKKNNYKEIISEAKWVFMIRLLLKLNENIFKIQKK